MKSRRKLLAKIFSFVACLGIFITVPFPAQAEDSLEEQLENLQDELRDIQEKQKQLESKISKENEEQAYLQSEINTYNNSIAQTELKIQETEKQIQVYNKQIELLAEQIETTELKIQLTGEEVDQRYIDLREISYNIYQNNQISTLDLMLSGRSVDESLFWTHYLNLSKEEGEKIIADLENLQAEQESAKAELESKKEESETLKSELVAETNSLEEQVVGLGSQKEKRQDLLADSQNEEAEYQMEKARLDEIEREIEQQMAAVEYQLLSRVASGSKVSKGDPIAQIGRTGHVRSSYVSGCPYPHPTKYPKYGSHLHYVMYIGDGRVNPLSYVGETFGHPTPDAVITQGYHSGHYAVDLAYWGPDATFGKPIYAACSGVVSYHSYPFDADDYGYPCGPFPSDPAHFFELECNEKYNGSTITFFGWHIRAR